MYGWCEKCNAITIDGTCSQHGETKLLPFVNALDIQPLPELEKKIINKNIDGKFKLGKGIFLFYNDRLYRRRVVLLDKQLFEVKLLKDGLHVNKLCKNRKPIDGMKKKDFCNANIHRINKLSKISKTFAEWEIAPISPHTTSHCLHPLQIPQFKHRFASSIACSLVNPSSTSLKL